MTDAAPRPSPSSGPRPGPRPGQAPRPLEIRLIQAEKALEIAFDDGRVFRYPAELLRVESPSAEVQGHNPDEKKLIPGRAQVGILGVEAVGHYAIVIRFDDLHDTGIYPWSYLYHLGENQALVWQGYLDRLAAAGLSRQP